MRISCLVLALGLLFYAMPCEAQQPAEKLTERSGQVKEKKQKLYRPAADFGTLHDMAKRDGVDTSKPESLKGRDVGAEIAKKTKL